MAAGMNGHADGPTIPASADTLLRFQPGRKAGEPESADAPVYLLAPPTEKMQRAYAVALAARGLRYPTDDELDSEMRAWLDDGRAAGMPEDQFDRQMRDIERHQDLRFDLRQEAIAKAREAIAKAVERQANGDAAPPPERPERRPRDQQLILDRYARLRRMAERDCPGVQELLAARLTFQREWARVMARVVLRGWERLPGAVVLHGTEADDATMACIDDETAEAITNFWQVQSALTEAQKKTSALPPPSAATEKTTPTTSDAAPSVPAIGHSRTTRSGTKSLKSIPAG